MASTKYVMPVTTYCLLNHLGLVAAVGLEPTTYGL